MGHGSSRQETLDESTDSSGSTTSRVQKLRQRLHLHRPHFRRHRGGSSSNSRLGKLLKDEDFAGIALLRLIGVYHLLHTFSFSLHIRYFFYIFFYM